MPDIEVHLLEQLTGAVVDRRARHRGAGQRRDGGGDRERVLQRHRQADPHAADDAGQRAGRIGRVDLDLEFGVVGAKAEK